MRDSERIDKILNKIGIFWKRYPDLRFCQMIFNILRRCKMDMFYLEDSEFEKLLDEELKDEM